MAAKSKILVIGGTGHIGKRIVEASVEAAHPTFALLRDSTLSNPANSAIINHFTSLGVHLLPGDMHDHESMVKAIKQVDVVISAVGHRGFDGQLAAQEKIIAAIKEAGNVKRFFPSEFGMDVDRYHPVEPAKTELIAKVKVRRITESEGIPYTYVSSNCFNHYFLSNLNQLGTSAPPRDQVHIIGDGLAKAIYNKEEDVASYTIKAVDDPRTLNKILYIRPEENTYSFNDLVSLWEKKIGKTLKRIYIAEEQLLKDIRGAETPDLINMMLSIYHSVFINGDQTNFEIEPSFGVEASQLYPDVKYTTVDEYLNHFV